MYVHVHVYVFLQFRIDRHGVIKVAEFGLTVDTYHANYYRQKKSKKGTMNEGTKNQPVVSIVGVVVGVTSQN